MLLLLSKEESHTRPHGINHFSGEVLNHDGVLLVKFLGNGRTLHDVREAVEETKAPPEGGRVLERLVEDGGQAPF